MQTAILKNAFYRVGQGALGMNLWNQWGRWPEKAWKPLVYIIETEVASWRDVKQ
jgi:hypothetical protein